MKLKKVFALLAFSNFLFGQSSQKWDVNNPPGNSKNVEFEVSEGTWMNIDVSPDGSKIAFDLLGDIYTMPVAGGEVTCLRSGLAWEVQPRWSPDGRQILFTSDVEGADNLFVMNADGTGVRGITKETFRLLNNAVWMPDGNYIIARKHFTATRSLGAGEMWMYHISGGDGIQITKRKNDQQDVNEPSVSPDGRFLYYSEDVYPGGYFQYNKDPNNEIFAVFRYDFSNGEIKKVAGGPGGACRPQVSPDGNLLAFVRRVREKTVLFVQNLSTGQEWPLYDGLSKDQQEAWTIFGIYPGFDWTPDGKNIILWAKGKLVSINVSTREMTNIPFKVKVSHKLMETVEFKNEAFEPSFNAKVLRNFVTSPDGNKKVFSALGHLYIKDGLKDPERLTNDTQFEAEPAFSPDGNQLVFVTWDDEKLGTVKILDVKNRKTRTLLSDPGIYRTPSFSPDGKFVVYRKEPGNNHQGYLFGKEAGLFYMPAEGGKPEFLTAEGEKPMFSADGKHVFYTVGGFLFGSISKSFKKIQIRDKKESVVFNTNYSTNFVPSPDNKWVAFTELYKVYIAAMPQTGQPIGLSSKTKAFPVSQVARDAGINLHWSSDSQKLHWTLGNEYFTERLDRRFLFLKGAADSIPPIVTIGERIILKVASDMPKGVLVLKNADIITMESDKIITKGLIIIEDNVIKYVGDGSNTEIPAGAVIMDFSGKTIMPGLIDVHAHLGAFRDGISPRKHWEYYANLAFGVTTTHDPSSNSEITFAQSEMVKAGTLVGPRIFSTGTILYGADGDFKAEINSLADAKSALRRTAAFGAFSVKSYNQPRREQRQMVIEAARQLNIRVVPEGGSFFFHNLTMVADGHTSVEHNLPVAPLYDDVIKFWSRSRTSNTPTLIVNYGGVNGEYYWYQHTDVWKNEKLLRFTPRAVIDSRSRHRTMIPDEEYQNGHILTAQSCKKLADAGVRINLGAHGQIQGLGVHWELWMMEQGGMSNYQALKTATINGAELLGMSHQIGTLATGKLADLIVLDKNPLENIRNSESVTHTMINGRLYQTDEMREIYPVNKPRTKFFWELEGSGNAYPMLQHGESLINIRCACGI